MRYPHFINGSYRPESVVVDCEETINLFYAKSQSEGAKSRDALYSTPGFSQRASVPNGPGRGAITIGTGRVFCVIGTGLYEYFQNNTYVLRGTVAIDGNPATLTANGDGGDQLFVTSGYKGYILDLTTLVFTTVLTSGATSGGYISGYFIAFDGPNSLIALSDLFDGLTWDPTQFAQRTMAPDPWVAMVVTGYSEANLIGNRTSEVWIDTGAAPFPLAPRQGLLIPNGTAAPWSAISFDSVLMYISASAAGSGIIVEATGYTPQAVSDDAITHDIGTYVRIDDAEAWSYQLDGHLFYVISFPSADKTWVYDRSTGKWHQWLTWDPILGEYHRERAHWHVHEWNTHFVLDNAGGGIYEMNNTFGLDIEEAPIRRVRAAPALNDENRLIAYKSFELLIETGLGTTTGQGFDPQALMEISNDAGRSYSLGRSRSMGKTGEFRIRLKWDRCGAAYDRAFRVVFSDPTPVRIVDAFLTLGAGVQDEAA